MVQIRRNAIIRRVKDITISSTLSLALLSGSGMIQSCGNSEEQEQVTVYTKGVQTHIKETEKGVFKIIDENTVEPDDSKVFITYLDGRIDTLNLEQARQIVDQRETQGEHNNGGSYHHQSGLSNVLLYGGMGYLMGRSFSSPPDPGYYANRDVYQRSQQNASTLSRSRATKPSNARGGFFSRSRSSGGGFGG
jgi:hypothetical protein